MSAYVTYTDEQLIILLKEDDESAFDTLYFRYWKKLFTLASNKLKDLHLAEELVQDIFINLWNRRKALEIRSNFAYYMAAAIKYKIIDACEKQEKIRLRELQHPQFEDQFDIADPSSFYFEFKDELARIMQTLPEKTRLVFELSKNEGFTHKEIAEHLEISEKTVEYHLSRAVKSLRTGLGNLFTILSPLL